MNKRKRREKREREKEKKAILCLSSSEKNVTTTATTTTTPTSTKKYYNGKKEEKSDLNQCNCKLNATAFITHIHRTRHTEPLGFRVSVYTLLLLVCMCVVCSGSKLNWTQCVLNSRTLDCVLVLMCVYVCVCLWEWVCVFVALLLCVSVFFLYVIPWLDLSDWVKKIVQRLVTGQLKMIKKQSVKLLS